MGNFAQDLRFGFRMLMKSPGFALIAVLSLALGVAANTATFSVVNAVILRPYAFPELDQLVLVRPALKGKPTAEQRLAPADFEELREPPPFASAISIWRGTARWIPLRATASLPNCFPCLAPAHSAGVCFSRKRA